MKNQKRSDYKFEKSDPDLIIIKLMSETDRSYGFLSICGNANSRRVSRKDLPPATKQDSKI